MAWIEFTLEDALFEVRTRDLTVHELLIIRFRTCGDYHDTVICYSFLE